MKKKIFFLCFVFAGIFIFSSHGWSFRCGLDLISTGDSKIKVSGICGAPTSKEQKCTDWNRETGACISSGETWHYNCGDSDFIYVLFFDRNGILTDETTAGRGFGPSNCRGR